MKNPFLRFSVLLGALLLGACSVAPNAPVATISTPMTVGQARQQITSLRGLMIGNGTSIMASNNDITSVKVERDSFTLNGRRFRFQDLGDLSLSAAHFDSAPAFLVLGNGSAIYTGLGDRANARARRIGDALLTLKAASRPEAVAAENARFDAVVASYHQADPKPAVTEEMRRYEVQAEAAVQDKQFDKAADLYDHALELAPWWPQAHFNRALLLESLAEYDLAIDEMQRYLKLMPDAPNARGAQDKIYAWELKAPAAP